MPAPTPPRATRTDRLPNPATFESDAALVSVRRSSVFMVTVWFASGAQFGSWTVSEIADANGAAGIEAEDDIEGIHHSGEPQR